MVSDTWHCESCVHGCALIHSLPDLQNVDITLRILFRPEEKALPWIFTHVGVDFDEKILPSITNEVLKGVVVSAESDWSCAGK